VSTQYQAKNTTVAIKLEEAPTETAGGLILPDAARFGRVATVYSAGEDSVLQKGDKVIRSAFGSIELDDLRFVDEDAIYCKVEDGNLAAFDGRLIVLVDPLTEQEKSLPEDVRLKLYITGRDNTLRYATVLDAGQFLDGKHFVRPWHKGQRVAVRPDVYDCLQVLPHDRELPFVDVPEGQEIRIYKADLATVSKQVPLILEDAVAA
jgi:co-chaperonin GroES (HSP10)